MSMMNIMDSALDTDCQDVKNTGINGDIYI